MPFPERSVRSKTGALSSAEWAVPSPEQLVHSDPVDSPFPERAVQSSKRAVRSKTGALHTQTADCLMRRVRRHRTTGR